MAISVYIHFPWCLQKCPYCDFASAGITRDAVPSQAYADAVLQELELRAEAVAGQELCSVFFGGGTPSLWAPEALGQVLSAVKASFPPTDDLEVTVECNPSSLDRARAAALREVGVNRLSIGVQSLDDQRLRFLGRLHDADGALRSLDAAKQEMPRVSADLMFGMPGQDPAAFLGELSTIVDRGLQHVSAYALTIEPDTQFGALHRKGRLQLAKDETFAATFERAEALMQARGLNHYEVSNYAAQGQESRHNLHYWQGGAYLGLGAGAVGCLHGSGPRKGHGRRYRNDPNPARYMEAGTAKRLAEVFEEQLEAGDLVREALMLGLRTADGIDVRALADRTGTALSQGRQQALAQGHAQGDLVMDGAQLRVPKQRWLHLDRIVADLF